MRPLRFYDIKAGKSFTTVQYRIVEVKSGRRVVRLGVAKSPYTGVLCYSFAPKRTAAHTATLTDFLQPG